MNGPKWEPYRQDALTHAGRVVPVHSLTKGLYERNVRTLIKRIVESAAPQVEDHLTAEVRERAGLIPLPEALAQVHFPDDNESLEKAQYRLGFDEFLFIQLGVLTQDTLARRAGLSARSIRAVHEDFLVACLHAHRSTAAHGPGDLRGYPASGPDGAPGPGRCRLRQDGCGCCSPGTGDRQWLPGCADGSDRDPGRVNTTVA